MTLPPRTELEALREDLFARHAEPARAYHTLEHLNEAFGLLDRHLDPSLFSDVDRFEIETALWFHDAIYDPRAKDNEEQSAELAVGALGSLGIDVGHRDRVSALILETRHDAVPSAPSPRLLVDVDLGILGASPERFDHYERQIREEYAWVSAADYRLGRTAILQAFLERDRIYATAAIRAEREAAARTNLTRSLNALRRA